MLLISLLHLFEAGAIDEDLLPTAIASFLIVFSNQTLIKQSVIKFIQLEHESEDEHRLCWFPELIELRELLES